MIVSTRLDLSHWARVLSSRLLVAVTAASMICQAAYDEPAWVSADW